MLLLSGFYASSNFFSSIETKIFCVFSLMKHHQWLPLWLVGTGTTPGLLILWGFCTCSFLLILSSALGDFLILMQLSVLSKNKTKTLQDETFANFWSFLYSYLDSANSILLWALQIFNSDFCIHGHHRSSIWVSSPFATAEGLLLGSKMEQL